MAAAPLSSFLGPTVDPAIVSTMLDSIFDGAYIAGFPEGALLWYNDAAAEIWGIRPTLPDSEARFLGTLQMYSLQGAAISWRHDSQALAVRDAVSVHTPVPTLEDALLVRQDGSRVHLQRRTRPIHDRTGKLVATLHQVHDISAYRQTVEALRSSEERFRQILQSTRDCIKVLDLEGRLISMNPEGQERLGIAEFSSVQGYSWIDMWTEPFRQMARSACESAAQGGTGRFEGQHIVPSGELTWWDVSITPILDHAHEITNLLAISREITGRRQAEEALRQNEKLAAVGRLAASISHEINNPLESVTNLIYLAQHSAHLDEIRQFLKMADDEVKRVSHIVNQTLRFHRQSTRAQIVDLHGMVSSILSLYRSRLAKDRISLSLRHRGTGGILCFEGNSRQVLSNLVANAIDSMQGGGRLLVRSQRATEWQSGRAGMKITIADTGVGITSGSRARLFQPFFTTKGENGTGLGLWISKEIVDRDGGVLKFRSRAASAASSAKSGTVFTFFLPDQPYRVGSIDPGEAA